MNTIGDHLDRLAKLYQVPNWDALNTVLLSEWIMETYGTEMLKVILNALTSPKSQDRNWRLTPDNVAEWIAVEQEAMAAKREQYIHNRKVEKPEPVEPQEISAETQRIIDEYQEKLLAGLSKVAPITEEEIRREGQKQPVKKIPVLPMNEVDLQIRDIANRYNTTIEAVKDLRHEWMRQCHDLYTGKPNANYLSFEEWLLK